MGELMEDLWVIAVSAASGLMLWLLYQACGRA
jgi:hypothetical protein